MQMNPVALPPNTSFAGMAGSTAVAPSGRDAMGFANEMEAQKYANMDVKDIKTKMVKVKTYDAHGNVKEVMKEMAVCPECGETNCPCIARITVQAKLDEENAKGVRNAEKPSEISIIPRTFNQISMNLGQNATNTSAYFK